MDEQGEHGPGKSVLVVEDELFIAMEIHLALVEGGYRVVGANSIGQALDNLRERRPDAAVLDVNLNGERVTPVAAELKMRKVPFVLTTATDPREIAAIPELADAPRFGKPTDLSDLLATLHGLLGFSGLQ